MSKETVRTRRLALSALLAALVAVMQVLSYVIPVRPFNLALVLIPIVVGACLSGPRTGAMLGGLFGVVVVIASIAGLDAGGAILWQQNPVMTALICLLKGVAAGLVPGLIAAAFRKSGHPAAGCWVAGLAAPILNTGIFLAGMLLVFRDVLNSWGEAWAQTNMPGADTLSYIVFGLLGLNFLIEFVLNAVFAPAIVRIVQAGQSITRREE